MFCNVHERQDGLCIVKTPFTIHNAICVQSTAHKDCVILKCRFGASSPVDDLKSQIVTSSDRLTAQLADQSTESAKLEKQIRENMRRPGYGG